jgi:glycerophosphoryl diester phosphodiesterase
VKCTQLIRPTSHKWPLNLGTSRGRGALCRRTVFCLVVTLFGCQSSETSKESPVEGERDLSTGQSDSSLAGERAEGGERGGVEESGGGVEESGGGVEESGGGVEESGGGVEESGGGVEESGGGVNVDEKPHAGDEETSMMAEGLARLIARLPPGPPPERFDCGSLPYQPPLITPERTLKLHCLHTEGCAEKLIVGHRGVGGDFGYIAPENSISAIRAALELGLDGVELDVRHSLDDELILMHDSSIDRTTVNSGSVQQMTSAMLTATRLRPPPISLDQGEGSGDFDCETIPTLERALELTRGRLFVDLDMKTDRVDLVVALLERLNLIDEVYISVSDPEVAVNARALNLNVRVQVRPDSAEEVIRYSDLFVRPPEIFEVPAHRLEETASLITSLGGRVFTDLWSADIQVATTGDASQYFEAFERGAQVIQTELPVAALLGLGRR